MSYGSGNSGGVKPIPHQIPALHDPDDLIQNKIDLKHIANMSHHMHVPDSITVGPNRSNSPRLNDDIPVRMEVPERIRPGGNGSVVLLTDSNFNNNLYHQEPSSSATTQHSLPSTMRHVDFEPHDDDYDNSTLPSQQLQRNTLQPSNAVSTDVWHIEPYGTDSNSNLVEHLIELRSLENRVHQIERSLQRRDFRDRLLYSAVFGYVLIQALLSIRRSILN